MAALLLAAMRYKSIYQHSKLPIASSTVPVPAAAASAKALELLMQQPNMRQQLWDNVSYAKKAFRDLGFEGIPDTPVPIICLSPAGVNLEKLQQQLMQKGLLTHYVPGGSYSSVPKGGAVRVALFSTHTQDQIDRLAAEVRALI